MMYELLFFAAVIILRCFGYNIYKILFHEGEAGGGK
jgi:hypothetical protein